MRFVAIGLVHTRLLRVSKRMLAALVLMLLAGSAGFAPLRPALASDSPAVGSIPANPTAAVTVASATHCGILSPSETWSATVIHEVTCTVTVPAGIVLTIEPGAVVKFSSAASLVIKGKINANGAPGNPIIFTSAADTSLGAGGTIPAAPTAGAPQEWGQIRFTAGSDDSSSISYAEIRYSGFDGVNTVAAVTLDNASPNLAYLSLHDNFLNAVEVPGTLWQTDTWDNMTIVYLVTGKLTVPSGKSLTIDPGIKVKFAANAGITVDGKLNAAGTLSMPITFTSHADDSVCGLGAAGEPVCDVDNDGATVGNPKDWGQIRFNAGSDDTSVVQYAVIQYSGFDGESVVGPIGLVDASPVLANLTLKGNRRNGVEISPEAWHTTTWNNPTVVYYVNGLASVAKDNTLTIAPGMKIKFAPLMGLDVDGKLLVAGTSESKVIFTSSRDDSVCGIGAANEKVCDTDGDGPTEGSTSDWKQIHFSAGSDAGSAVRYAVIRFAGGRGSSGKLPGFAAIQIDGGAPTVERTLLTQNLRGIDVMMGATPALICNDLYMNSATDTNGNNNFARYDIYVEKVDTPVDARNQWWGSIYGPWNATSNPGGIQDISRVSDGVIFAPWRMQSCLVPPPVPPNHVSVQTTGAFTLTVTWVNPAADATAIDLFRSMDGENWKPIQRLAPNVSSFVDSGLDCASTYNYRVRSFRETDYQVSDFTAPVAARTADCPRPTNVEKIYLPLLYKGVK